MPRVKSQYLTKQQDLFVRMEASGCETDEIIKALFGLKRGDEGYHAAECKLSRWRQHPKYEEVWKDEVRKQDFADYTMARKTLRRTMRADDQWLAMQSAVNVMNNSGKRIYQNEENTVNVQISGMPDIGSPDQEE